MGSRKAKSVPVTNTDTATTVATPIATDRIPGEGLGVRLDKRQLEKAVRTFSTLVDRKSTMPILANLSLRSDGTGSGITITGTDLNVSMRVQLTESVYGARAGGISVPQKRLAEILKTLPTGEITLYQSGTTLVIDSGTATVRVDGFHDRDTPKFPALAKDDAEAYDGKPWPSLVGATLTEMIGAVKHGVCLDETRFHLNGILVEIAGSTMRMITTDGHRLVKCERTLVSGTNIGGTPLIPSKNGALVPRKACLELTKHLDDDACEVLFTKTHAWFRQGGMTLVTKLIDAQFPPYEQVIPKDHRRILTVGREALAGALNRAKVNCSETRGALLSLATGKLTVEGSDPDAGTITETLDADYQGEACKIGVNPRYMLDALAQIEGASVVIAFGTEGRDKKIGILDPVLVRSLDDAAMRPVMGASLLVVIMPMRV